MKLPKKVEYIINRINQCGHRADVVGGPVRDFLLGKQPSDYDLTTDALPSEIKEIFFDCRTIDTGIKHGTVTLLIDGESFEITTYRIDGEYKDSRHPETVEFTSDIVQDLSRRDFTVNAMAYNPRDGITDPFGGREDLTAQLIRAVGEPDRRFSEDALRILRGIRFAATLGFTVEDATRVSIFEKKELLLRISAERILAEWRKILLAPHAHRVIWDYAAVIEVFLPELSPLQLPDEKRFAAASPICRAASIFYISRGADAAAAFDLSCRRLKTDTAYREQGVRLLSNIEKYDISTPTGVKNALISLGDKTVLELCELKVLLGMADERCFAVLQQALTDGTPRSISELEINGNDLIKIGFSGAEIGAALSQLLAEASHGRVANDKTALKALALILRNTDNNMAK